MSQNDDPNISALDAGALLDLWEETPDLGSHVPQAELEEHAHAAAEAEAAPEPEMQALRHSRYEGVLAQEAREDMNTFGASVRRFAEDEEAPEVVREMAPHVADDAFLSLYQNTPLLRDQAEIDPAYARAAAAIGEMIQTKEWGELHAQTRMHEFYSALGASSVYGKLIEELRKQEEEQAKQQGQQPEGQQQEGGHDDEQGETQAPDAGGPQSGAPGVGDGAGAPEEAAGQGAGQGSDGAAAGAAPGAGGAGGGQQPTQGTQGGIGPDQRQALRRAARKAAKAATQQVTEMRDLEETFGDLSDGGEPGDQPGQQPDGNTGGGTGRGIGGGTEHYTGEMSQRVARARRLRQDARLLRIAQLAGRMRPLLAAAQRRKTHKAQDEIVGVILTEDWEDMLPSEIALAGHPQLGLDFWRRFADGGVLGVQRSGMEKQGRGPIIICTDESGSMSGDPDCWAKAVFLSFQSLAQKQRRPLRLVHFAWGKDQIRVSDYPKGRGTLQQTVADCKHFWSGGTSFEEALEKALESIEASEYKHADVIFITDGLCSVSPDFLVRWHKAKKEKQFRCYGVLVNRYGGQSVLESFCDVTAALGGHLTDGGDEDFLMQAFAC